MSHFGRSGPPDISETFSLLVLNLTFRTNADDLYPLFGKYGEVMDIHLPRDRRTGESRGFGFVRFKYADEAQKAVERLDGRDVDGREIRVQFAKYGPNSERIHKGRVIEAPLKSGRSRSRSPRRRYRDDDRDRDYRRRSRSRSLDRRERDRYHCHDRDYRSRSRSASPDYHRSRRGRRYDNERHGRDSVSPVRRTRTPSPQRTPDKEIPNRRSRHEPSPTAWSVSPQRPSAGSP